jgi:hypothetical protein
LRTIPNPTPTVYERFGTYVSGLGSDKVLIGSSGDDTFGENRGAAYSFDLEGSLLATFINPSLGTQHQFTRGMTGVGKDAVLIGAPQYGSGGRASLFETNGTLTRHLGASGSGNFGFSVADMGLDRVAVGSATDYAGGPSSGAVHLFDLQGALLTTVTNPAPASGDWFGLSIAALQPDILVVGASLDDLGSTDAGAAYLFQLPLPPPALRISSETADTAVISWPSAYEGFELERTTSPAVTNWTTLGPPPEDDGVSRSVRINLHSSNEFFRLVD